MIDASVKYITLRDHQFTSVNGYSWVDISVLIQECVELVSEVMVSEVRVRGVRFIKDLAQRLGFGVMRDGWIVCGMGGLCEGWVG